MLGRGEYGKVIFKKLNTHLLGFIDGISPAENGCEMFVHVNIMQVCSLDVSVTYNKQERKVRLFFLETGEVSQ
jgi:hypothetical protein